MAHAALKQHHDNSRLDAAHVCLQALPAFERHHRDDMRPRMAITTALDYADGRLDVMADHQALERCRQWVAASAREAINPQSKAAALAVAATCEPTVNIEAVRRLVSAALD